MSKQGLIGQTLLDRYRVLFPIARGGMGAVYEAHDERVDRRVAVKVLIDELVEDTTCVERFRREAKAVASTHHPALVALHDLSLDSKPAFLVMELIEGRSVAEILMEEGRMGWFRSVRIALDVLDGLQCLHEAGIVHRDLKPANVMVTGAGERERAKVIDLGVAQLTTGAVYQKLTATGAVVGTPAFMSPEQLAGDPVGPATDIWATGVLLYACLTGQRPFVASEVAALLFAIGTSNPTPIQQISPDVPVELGAIVMGMLQKKPEDRPRSARIAARSLRAMMERAGAIPATRQAGQLATDEPAVDRPREPSGSLAAQVSAPAQLSAPAQVAAGEHASRPGMLQTPALQVPQSSQALPSAGISRTWLVAGVLGLLTTGSLCVGGAALGAFLYGRQSAAITQPVPSSGTAPGPGLPTSPPGPVAQVHSGPTRLAIDYGFSDYGAAASRAVGPTLDPQLEACVTLSSHGMGIIGIWLVYIDPAGHVTRVATQDGPTVTTQEADCIEPLLRSAAWPPPEGRDPLQVLTLVGMY